MTRPAACIRRGLHGKNQETAIQARRLPAADWLLQDVRRRACFKRGPRSYGSGCTLATKDVLTSRWIDTAGGVHPEGAKRQNGKNKQTAIQPRRLPAAEWLLQGVRRRASLRESLKSHGSGCTLASKDGLTRSMTRNDTAGGVHPEGAKRQEQRDGYTSTAPYGCRLAPPRCSPTSFF